MDMKSVIGCSNQTVPRQGLRGDRKALPPTTRSSRPDVRHVGCRAAAEPATQDEVTAAVEADPSEVPVAPPSGSNGNEQAAAAPRQAPRRRQESIAKYQLDDLKVGEWYDGVVASTASYGLFFDIGAGKAALCHVSQLSEQYVSDGAMFLSIGEKRRVRILSVEPKNNRISISLLEPNVKESSPRRPQGEQGQGQGQDRRLRSDRPSVGRSGGRGGEGGGRGMGGGRGRGRGARSEGFAASSRSSGLPMPDVKVGDKITARVKRMERFGLFLSIEEGKKDGLMTPANMGLEGPATESEYSMGQEIEVWVASVDDGKIALSTLSPEERKAVEDATRGKGGGAASTKSQGPKLESGLSAMALAFRNVGLEKAKAPEPEVSPKKDEAETTPKEAEPTAQAPSAVEAAVEQPAAVEEAAAVPEKPEKVQLDPEAVPSAQATLEAPQEVKEEEPVSKEEVPVSSPEQPKAVQKADSIDIEDSLANLQPEAVENSIHNTSPPQEADLPEAKAPKAEEEPAAIKESTKASLAQERSAAKADAAKEEAPAAVEEATTSEPSNPIEAAVESAKEAAEEAKDTVVEAAKPAVEAAEEAKDTVVEAAQPAVEAAEAAKDTVVEAAQPAVEAAEEAKDTVVEAAQPAVEAAEEAKDIVLEASPVSVGEVAKEEKDTGSKASQPAQAGKGKAKKEGGGSGKVIAGAAVAKGSTVSAKTVKELREKTGAGMMECKKALQETDGDMEAAVTFLRKKGLAGADKKAGRIATEGLVSSYIHAGSGIGVLIEVNCETDFVARGDIFKGLCSDLAMQIAAFGDVVAVSRDDIDPAVLEKEREIEMGKEDILSKPEDKRAMIVEGRIAKSKMRMSLMDQPYIKDNSKNVQSVVKETIAQLGENIKVRRFERYVLGEGVQKKVANLAKEVEEQKAKMKEEAEARAAQPKEEVAEPLEGMATFKVDAKAVGELRKASGAGMMDCKRALAANDGDLEKSKDYLRKKGLASADKKAGRVASEGAVASYIHGSSLGILVEVNCETDFVAKGDVFQTLAADMAMQLASNPQVEAISKDDFPQENLEKERQVALQMEDIQSKPENIREKIVDGRLSKFASERSLLEQSFIKDTKITVGQHIKETIAKLGENISVRRFTRYGLGEGLAKREENFAEEIAKASAAK